jgi:hypothetical protein
VAKDIDAKISRNSPIKTCIHSHCPYESWINFVLQNNLFRILFLSSSQQKV